MSIWCKTKLAQTMGILSWNKCWLQLQVSWALPEFTEHWGISSRPWFKCMLATAGTLPLLLAKVPLTVNKTRFMWSWGSSHLHSTLTNVIFAPSHLPGNNSTFTCWSCHQHKVSHAYFEELQQMTKFCGSESYSLMLLFSDLIF